MTVAVYTNCVCMVSMSTLAFFLRLQPWISNFYHDSLSIIFLFDFITYIILITYFTKMLLPSDLLWEYMIELVFMECPCIVMTFPTWSRKRHKGTSRSLWILVIRFWYGTWICWYCACWWSKRRNIFPAWMLYAIFRTRIGAQWCRLIASSCHLHCEFPVNDAVIGKESHPWID